MSFVETSNGLKEYFDYCFYIRTYKDLSHIKTLKQAIDHYNKCGRKEGRRCNNLSPVCSYVLGRITLNAQSAYADIGIKNLLILIDLLPDYAFLEPTNLKKIPNTVRFVYGEYIKMYPDYKEIFGKNFKDCELNFWKHARTQKLLPNLKIAKLMEIYQEYTLEQYNKKFSLSLLSFAKGREEKEEKENVESPEKEDKRHFIIITRTHNREKLFNECHQNIMQQSTKNIKVTHVVSFDNEETESYVKEALSASSSSIVACKISEKVHPNVYFDIIMESLKSQLFSQLEGSEDSEGSESTFVIFLDDDDKFTYNNVLTYLSYLLSQNPQSTQKSSLLIWKFYRNDKYIEIPQERIDNPIVGDVATCSYCFNINDYSYGKWKPSSIGDFDFFKFLYYKTPKENRIFIDMPLTRVNYTGKISGWTAQ